MTNPITEPIIVRHDKEPRENIVRYIPVTPDHEAHFAEKPNVIVTPSYDTPKVVVAPASYAYNMHGDGITVPNGWTR